MNRANAIGQRLEKGEILILDGAIGTELERLGAPMDKAAWCATAVETHPELVRQVHQNYIDAGVDVITANTYASTHLALETGGVLHQMDSWNRRAVGLARDAIDSTDVDREIYLAGSVSNFGSFGKGPVETIRAHFREQAEILVDVGVDLLLLETLAARPQVIAAMVEETANLGLPVWVAVSCVQDCETGEVMLGIEESQSSSKHRRVHQPLKKTVEDLARNGGSALLLMHSDLKATLPGLKVMRDTYPGPRGVYPNAGHWLRPQWAFVDQVTPEDYLNEARLWLETGVQIIGGCCGIGPDHITALHRGLR